MLRNLLVGLVAGAAGTVTLNAVTNLDMVGRARPASSVPATVAGEMAERANVERLRISNEDERAQNRRSGAGAAFGIATGLGIGAGYGLLRSKVERSPVVFSGPALGLVAMAASDVPATALNVTDPRSWGANEWLSDLVPHLAYGVVTAAVYNWLER